MDLDEEYHSRAIFESRSQTQYMYSLWVIDLGHVFYKTNCLEAPLTQIY